MAKANIKNKEQETVLENQEETIKENKLDTIEDNNQEVVVENEQTLSEDESYQTAIEEARLDMFKHYSKTRKISNIMMFGAVVIIAAIMFMITSNNNILRIVGYCLVGALVVALVTYYIVNRNKFPNRTKQYVDFVVGKMNDRLFNHPNFSKLQFDPTKRLDLSDLISDGVYGEASGINSRNVVTGQYKNATFTYGEAALIKTVNRKKPLPPLFVGRYLSLTNKLKFDDRFVLTFKNSKEAYDLPNAVSDLVVLQEENNLIVYGKEGSDYHAVIKNTVISKLNKIAIEKNLLNINIAFWGGRTAVYLSYDDATMSVPFDKPFDQESFEKSVDHLQTIFKTLLGE